MTSKRQSLLRCGVYLLEEERTGGGPDRGLGWWVLQDHYPWLSPNRPGATPSPKLVLSLRISKAGFLKLKKKGEILKNRAKELEGGEVAFYSRNGCEVRYDMCLVLFWSLDHCEICVLGVLNGLSPPLGSRQGCPQGRLLIPTAAKGLDTDHFLPSSSPPYPLDPDL